MFKVCGTHPPVFRLLILLVVLILPGCQATKLRKKTADERILDLQKGVLLVRLQTAQRKAESIRELGKREEATAVLEEQQALNDRIRAAFETHYDLSPVFFFNAPDSRLVRERRFDGIIRDVKDEPALAADVMGKPFLVAEFGEVRSPSAGAGLNALILLDEELHELAMPFPFAVPTHLFPEAEQIERAVAKLNLKLKDFYAKAIFREQKRELRKLRQGL